MKSNENYHKTQTANYGSLVPFLTINTITEKLDSGASKYYFWEDKQKVMQVRNAFFALSSLCDLFKASRNYDLLEWLHVKCSVH